MYGEEEEEEEEKCTYLRFLESKSGMRVAFCPNWLLITIKGLGYGI